MAINATNIYPAVEELSEHYKKNLSNRFLRKAMNHLTLDRGDWDLIDDLLLNCELVKVQSYSYLELYERIFACAKLVDKARREIGGNIRGMAGPALFGQSNKMDKVLFEMAVSNFKSNLSIFADDVHSLYLRAVEADKEEHRGGSPAFLKIPELKEIGKMLVG